MMGKSKKKRYGISSASLEDKITRKMRDTKLMKQLLFLEKKRRKKRKSDLVFLGMANIAKYCWCSIKSVLDSRKDEPLFFRSYLYDRLRYSYELGRLDKLPRTNEALLDIGSDITQEDIENLLKKREKEKKEVFPRKVKPSEKKLDLEMEREMEKMGLTPIELGSVYQMTRAESYASIRWNFSWRDYVVVGVPDGITKEFVYEFKSTGNPFLMRYEALAQAELYGHFFRRPTKRVQIFNRKTKETETIIEPVSDEHAIDVLERFKMAVDGIALPLPKPFKCRNCAYLKTCKSSPLKNSPQQRLA